MRLHFFSSIHRFYQAGNLNAISIVLAVACQIWENVGFCPIAASRQLWRRGRIWVKIPRPILETNFRRLFVYGDLGGFCEEQLHAVEQAPHEGAARGWDMFSCLPLACELVRSVGIFQRLLQQTLYLGGLDQRRHRRFERFERQDYPRSPGEESARASHSDP